MTHYIWQDAEFKPGRDVHAMTAPKSVNEPYPKMSEAELRENHAYWSARVKDSPGLPSAKQADRFLREIEREMAKRGMEIPS